MRCRISGSFGAHEIPLLVMLFYLFCYIMFVLPSALRFWIEVVLINYYNLCRRQCQVGSLAGAAHLLNNNTGVLRSAQWEQKSHVEQKGKSWLDFDFQYEYKPRKRGLSILSFWEFQARGVRKVTTGITGLWLPSVHSDVAFWSFDVGSSYHSEAEFW